MARYELDVQLEQLLQISSEMLVLAKEEAWDDFELKCADYHNLAAYLPEVIWTQYTATERDEIAQQLQAIKRLHQQILPFAQEWHAELKGMLQNQIKLRRLDEKYR